MSQIKEINDFREKTLGIKRRRAGIYTYTDGLNQIPIVYPISVRDYINSLCLALGITFKNKGLPSKKGKQIPISLGIITHLEVRFPRLHFR